MTKNITVFTTSTCSYCPMVKRYLQSKGLSYDEVNLEEHPDRQAEILEMSGALTVPITVVTNTDDSQQVIVGYNLQNSPPPWLNRLCRHIAANETSALHSR